ncbi:MAG: methyltransferase domain-containing protein [Pseudomonadota bacterium]
MENNSYTAMAETENQHWWFIGRRKILSHLLSSIQLMPNSNILEIGSGTGGNWEWLHALPGVNKQLNFIEKNALARELFFKKTGKVALAGTLPNAMPPLPQQDLICLFDVLEHIENDQEALVTLYYLLKPLNGKLILTVPAHPILYGTHDKQLHHFRRYTKKELIAKLTKAGFKINKIRYYNFFLFPLAFIARFLDLILKRESALGVNVPSRFINTLFKAIFQSEAFWLQHFSFPTGISLYVECSHPFL